MLKIVNHDESIGNIKTDRKNGFLPREVISMKNREKKEANLHMKENDTDVDKTEKEQKRLTDDELDFVAGGVAPIIKPPPKP